MKILCQHCLREIDFNLENIGKELNCPYCGKQVETGPDNPLVKRAMKKAGIEIPGSESERPKTEAKSSRRIQKEVKRKSVLFICPSCGSRYKLNARKIPRGREFKLRCKTCGEATITDFEKLQENTDSYFKSQKEFRDSFSDKDRRAGKRKASESGSGAKKPVGQSQRSRNHGASGSSSKNEPDLPEPSTYDEVNKYFVRTGGEKFGPLSLTELERWAHQGLLKADDEISVSGGIYQPAKTLPELKGRLREPQQNAKSVKQIPEDEAQEWNLKSLAKGIVAGVMGGFVFSIFMILLSLFTCSYVATAIVARDNAGVTIFTQIFLTLLLWITMGGLVGGVFSLIQGFFSMQGEWIQIWEYSYNWIGAIIGVVIGMFLFLFGQLGLFGILFMALIFLVLNALVIFSYKTFLKDSDLAKYFT